MNEEDIFKLIGYVIASQYRTNIIKCIGNDIKIPSVIAEEVGLRTNHVSNVLNQLKEEGIVVCLNEEARKGRLYKNTDLGIEILKYI
ncbi:helix-turn-helix domain-containing protein [Methanobrevibacter sp.]|uniref:helix-turn-helix domain-containing protein n=1 Tax=Methanobrevibacter sp. TaxID=66852 RepID=UPI0026E0BCFD|nr:helix-turn-helix domain-containing protein [Methanobrevibacter sp.]MDO5859773.1 helix-turn-helix domain-containing protein [Methanobrevibacter sp.]